MTCSLKNKQSYHSLMRTLNRYSICSGLRINREKTEILLLGPEIAVSKEELDVKEIRMAVKILGIHFTYNNALFRKLNFDSIMKSIKKSLNNWKWRGLTPMGKIQIIKSFVVPKILYRAAVLPIEKDFLKEIISVLFLLSTQSRICSMCNSGRKGLRCLNLSQKNCTKE